MVALVSGLLLSEFPVSGHAVLSHYVNLTVLEKGAVPKSRLSFGTLKYERTSH